MKARSPIERLIDSSGLKCTICGARAGACSCWVECPCGFTVERGQECRNPVHAEEAAAATLAADLARNVIAHMRSLYPEPMRHASGGFRKTLQAVIEREAAETIKAVFRGIGDAKAEHEKSRRVPAGVN